MCEEKIDSQETIYQLELECRMLRRTMARLNSELAAANAYAEIISELHRLFWSFMGEGQREEIERRRKELTAAHVHAFRVRILERTNNASAAELN